MARHCHECEGKGYVINDLTDEDEQNLDFVFACIVCNVYADDIVCATYLSLVTGRELRWAMPTNDHDYRPYLV